MVATQSEVGDVPNDPSNGLSISPDFCNGSNSAISCQVEHVGKAPESA